jgi:tRNA(fMet)-specific endonuclease VapC
MTRITTHGQNLSFFTGRQPARPVSFFCPSFFCWQKVSAEKWRAEKYSNCDRARYTSAESQRLRFRLSSLRKDKLATTIITFEEQMRGWLSWLAQARSVEQQVERYRRLKRMLTSYHDVIILDFDEKAAGELQRRQKQRVRIGTMDLKIAALALANNATLLSRNLKDFRKVPDLKVEDWAA